tara:strand:+ start:248 stop:448 length:201 start_codon:yes stop_codon:yes gene_type:complete
MGNKYMYKCFLRSTSNVDSKTHQKQLALPSKIWKQVGWKLNENLILNINKDKSITITKDKTDYENK